MRRLLLAIVAIPLAAAECPERTQQYVEMECSASAAVRVALPAGVKQMAALAIKEPAIIRVVAAAAVPARCFRILPPAESSDKTVLRIRTCLSNTAYIPVLIRQEKNALFLEPRP